MVELFGRRQSMIARHIGNVFAEGDLPREGSMQILHRTPDGGRPATFYNLDLIISVGYRVKSMRGTQFGGVAPVHRLGEILRLVRDRAVGEVERLVRRLLKHRRVGLRRVGLPALPPRRTVELHAGPQEHGSPNRRVGLAELSHLSPDE